MIVVSAVPPRRDPRKIQNWVAAAEKPQRWHHHPPVCKTEHRRVPETTVTAA